MSDEELKIVLSPIAASEEKIWPPYEICNG